MQTTKTIIITGNISSSGDVGYLPGDMKNRRSAGTYAESFEQDFEKGRVYSNVIEGNLRSNNSAYYIGNTKGSDCGYIGASVNDLANSAVVSYACRTLKVVIQHTTRNTNVYTDVLLKLITVINFNKYTYYAYTRGADINYSITLGIIGSSPRKTKSSNSDSDRGERDISHNRVAFIQSFIRSRRRVGIRSVHLVHGFVVYRYRSSLVFRVRYYVDRGSSTAAEYRVTLRLKYVHFARQYNSSLYVLKLVSIFGISTIFH